MYTVLVRLHGEWGELGEPCPTLAEAEELLGTREGAIRDSVGQLVAVVDGIDPVTIPARFTTRRVRVMEVVTNWIEVTGPTERDAYKRFVWEGLRDGCLVDLIDPTAQTVEDRWLGDIRSLTSR